MLALRCSPTIPVSLFIVQLTLQVVGGKCTLTQKAPFLETPQDTVEAGPPTCEALARWLFPLLLLPPPPPPFFSKAVAKRDGPITINTPV